jgi:hypothetical protein
MSAKKYNPDWTIKLHMPARLGDMRSPIFLSGSFMACRQGISLEDYTQQLASDIQIVKHDFSLYGFRNDAHEVHKSDFIRWKILVEEGGVWSDTDILYTKPMSSMIGNVPSNQNVDSGICKYHDVDLYAIGFLFSSPGSPIYKKIHQHSYANYTSVKCQCIGTELFSALFGSPTNSTIGRLKSTVPNSNPLFIDPDVVYSINGPRVDKFFTSGLNVGAFPKAIGFHWYGGCPKSSQAEMLITDKNLQEHNYFLADIIKHIHKH